MPSSTCDLYLWCLYVYVFNMWCFIRKVSLTGGRKVGGVLSIEKEFSKPFKSRLNFEFDKREKNREKS